MPRLGQAANEAYAREQLRRLRARLPQVDFWTETNARLRVDEAAEAETSAEEAPLSSPAMALLRV